MTEPTENPVLSDSAALLVGYGFDLGTFAVDDLMLYWSSHYPLHWLRAAILEALHQGRYKAISVGQILVIWRRRGQPLPHYSYEFERAVCDRFPPSRIGSTPLSTAPSTPDASDRLGVEKLQATESSSDNPSPDNPSHTATADSGDLVASQTLDKSDAEEAVDPLKPLDPAPDVVINSSLGGEPNDIGAKVREVVPKISTADGEAIAPLSDLKAFQSGLDEPFSDNASSLIQSDVDANDTASSLLGLALPRSDWASDATSDDAAQSTDSASQPGMVADLSTHTETLEFWGRASIMHLPIHQYVPVIPRSETSTFYAKLRAVAYSDDML